MNFAAVSPGGLKTLGYSLTDENQFLIQITTADDQEMTLPLAAMQPKRGKPWEDMATINSVLGEIDSKDLGFTLMHEHVMVAASGLSIHYPDLLGPNREGGH